MKNLRRCSISAKQETLVLILRLNFYSKSVSPSFFSNLGFWKESSKKSKAIFGISDYEAWACL